MCQTVSLVMCTGLLQDLFKNKKIKPKKSTCGHGNVIQVVQYSPGFNRCVLDLLHRLNFNSDSQHLHENVCQSSEMLLHWQLICISRSFAIQNC